MYFPLPCFFSHIKPKSAATAEGLARRQNTIIKLCCFTNDSHTPDYVNHTPSGISHTCSQWDIVCTDHAASGLTGISGVDPDHPRFLQISVI